MKGKWMDSKYRFFSISEDAFYSTYSFFHRFRKMLFEAKIIDSIFYVFGRDYIYIVPNKIIEIPIDVNYCNLVTDRIMHCSHGKSNYGNVSITILSPCQVKNNYGNGPIRRTEPSHVKNNYGKITAGNPQAKKEVKGTDITWWLISPKSWVKWNYGNMGPELAQLKPYSVLTFFLISIILSVTISQFINFLWQENHW